MGMLLLLWFFKKDNGDSIWFVCVTTEMKNSKNKNKNKKNKGGEGIETS